jgi:nitrogen regulatory protein PII 1
MGDPDRVEVGPASSYPANLLGGTNMKIIQAMVRPEKEAAIAYELAKANFPAFTKWDVVGRGKQMGINVGSQLYDELSKTFFLIVVEDEQVDPVLAIF